MKTHHHRIPTYLIIRRALERRIQLEMLANGEARKQNVVLRAHAEELANLAHLAKKEK